MKSETAYPSYPAYKDSGIEWLGKVPEHWARKRLRFVAKLNPSKSEVSHLVRETLISFLPMEAIGDDGNLTLDREKMIGEVETGYTYFSEDDVTIAKITPCFENGKGAVMQKLRNGIGFGTTELIVVRPLLKQSASKYLHWLFLSTPFRKLGEAQMYGAGGQKRVPDDFVRNFAISFPPLTEQQAIAAFLDRETAKIDTLIGKQECLVSFLTEKRQAVISHAVIKGLDPNVPMKDSGIEWLGEVPEHWEVKRLKHASQMESGHTPTRDIEENWSAEGYLWLSLADSPTLRQTTYVSVTQRNISALGIQHSSARLLPKGTVFLSRDATVGLTAIARQEMACSQHFVGWIPRAGILSEYIRLSIITMQDFLASLSTGSTIPTIGLPEIKQLVTPVPPVAEQRAIVTFLDCEIAKIDKLIEKAKQSIELMKERRSALISAAVTGKIDVREMV